MQLQSSPGYSNTHNSKTLLHPNNFESPETCPSYFNMKIQRSSEFVLSENPALFEGQIRPPVPNPYDFHTYYSKPSQSWQVQTKLAPITGCPGLT